MSYRYDHTVYFTLGGNEREVRITYTVTPGEPETGPSYACAGTPAEPPEVEIERVEVEVVTGERFGKPMVKTWEPAPRWMIDMIEADEAIHADMLEAAGEGEEYERAA